MAEVKSKISNGLKTFGRQSKNVFFKVTDFLGFKKNSPYVNAYIHRANIRSGIFMAAVVAILEVWLVIRQHQKYIIPDIQSGVPYFSSLFNNTSLYWLQMVMGISMFLYCLYYLKEKPNKILMISIIAISSIGIVLCSLLPLEKRISEYSSSRLVDTVLLVCLYAAILSYHIVAIIAVILKYRGKKIDWLQSVTVITIFATCLLIFGIKVSYGDFTSLKKYDGVLQPNHDYKMIICFLMMAIYVGCLLIWRPYISVAILGSIFLGFYFLLKYANPSTREFSDGDKVNYITFFISLLMVSVSIFNQRQLEAHKDEELEILATQDKLTGLLSFEYFCTLCSKKIQKEQIEDREYLYLFLDITSFKILNDQKGFDYGNSFLRKVGEILSSVFKDELISRQGDDHYVVFAKADNIENKIDLAEERIKLLEPDIKPGIKAGGYLFFKDRADPHTCIEKARYAFSMLKETHGHANYLRYDHNLSNRYKLVQYIVSHVDEAIANNWIKAYYQPVVFAKDRKLCGVEALARWIDPEHGFLNPGIFIPSLEDAQLAYKLDLAMLEIVCKNMRRVLDSGETVVPTSINFSRSDFSIVDIPNEIVRITKKYNIPTHYLHIEITESALLEKTVDLAEAMRRIKENGFSIWLDDFGSGYSSFNALKDYEFDVLKLDMEFLKGFESNKKSKPLIKAVIDLAGHINMRTLAEGVETEEQASFLNSIGCEKLQGYLISKPITYEELNDGISKGQFVISKNMN